MGYAVNFVHLSPQDVSLRPLLLSLIGQAMVFDSTVNMNNYASELGAYERLLCYRMWCQLMEITRTDTYRCIIFRNM